MKLFVGLGNPGSSYARHRHNVGFMALGRIAETHGAGPWKKRFHGLTSDAQIGGRKVVLLKPQTYMNDSGQSVGEALRYLKLDEGDLYVFHDELDLAPGKLKLKTGGGNAGQSGRMTRNGPFPIGKGLLHFRFLSPSSGGNTRRLA